MTLPDLKAGHRFRKVVSFTARPFHLSLGIVALATLGIFFRPLPLLAQVVEEFPIPSGSNGFHLTGGPDGAVWFTEQGRMGRVRLFEQVTEFPLAPNASPEGIAPGPDGALWFTEAGKIGRMTTTGSLTEFPEPYPAPRSIVAGPDGALWFTNFFEFFVGRITTTGQTTVYPTLPTSIGPDQITAGSDGALWFTEFMEPRINRMTTSGQITTFPIASAITTGLTTGPDGALWLAIPGAGIARVTTAGVYTLFPVSSVAGGPGTIAASSDGYLWFVENAAGKIGRISTSGILSELSIPASVVPREIARGPDGAMWFTESGQAKIGRIALGVTSIPTLGAWGFISLALSLAILGSLLRRVVGS